MLANLNLNATNYNVNQALYFLPKKKKSWSSHEQICALARAQAERQGLYEPRAILLNHYLDYH